MRVNRLPAATRKKGMVSILAGFERRAQKEERNGRRLASGCVERKREEKGERRLITPQKEASRRPARNTGD
jgi:hypothetical protein